MSSVEASDPAETSLDPPRITTDRYQSSLQALEDLERWMSDTLQRGLAEAREQPPDFWETRAARMTDAKLPGVASMLRRIALLPAGRADWAEIVFSLLCRMQLLIDGFRKLNELPAALQHDLVSRLGWRQMKRELAETQPEVADDWTVLGTRRREEDVFVADSTWLHGRETGQTGLLLEFTPQARVPEAPWPAGTVLRGKIVYYRTALRQRLCFKEEPVRVQEPVATPALVPDFTGAAQVLSRDLARNPWHESCGVTVAGVRLHYEGTDCHLLDKSGVAVPVDPEFEGLWKFLAISGEGFVPLFGEWTGIHFSPISILHGNRIINLDPQL